jgi:hypothetical protein
MAGQAVKFVLPSRTMTVTERVFPACVQRAYLYLERDVDPGDPPYSDDALDLMDFDPDAATWTVGLRPTRAWRRGDPSPPNPRPHQCSGWQYGLPPAKTYHTEQVVAVLLTAVEPYADGIATACRTLGLRAGIRVVIQMTARYDGGAIDVTTATVSCGTTTIQRLARLNLSLACDQYVH